MSNLSDIGFPTPDETAVNEMIMHVLEHCKPRQTTRGVYLVYTDPSGAEIYLQGNHEQELIGFNPHFAGKSRRRVRLTAAIERDSSELDGGFHGWAAPSDDADGEYPFVFDLPDFRDSFIAEFPMDVDVQLTAFGSNDFELHPDEAAYFASQTEDVKFAANNFIPVGLFAAAGENGESDLAVARPVASFAGAVTEWERRRNEISGEDFYWLLVETLGGPVDVVIDPKYVTTEPAVGSIASGTFWLSGRLLG